MKKKNSRTRILIVCILSLALSVTAADWPSFRGPDYAATSPEKDWDAEWTEAPPIWEAKVETGASSVAVVDGRVYTLGFTKARGDEHKTLKEKYPEIEPNGIEHLYCFDAATGDELWRVEMDIDKFYGHGSHPTPAVKDGRVYAYGGNGMLFCVDAVSGKVVWEVDTFKKYGLSRLRNNLASSPMLYDGKVHLHVLVPEGEGTDMGHYPASNVGTIAIDAETAEEAWRSKVYDNLGGGNNHNGGCWSSPVYMELEGTPTLVSYYGNMIAGLNPKDGTELWAFRFKEEIPRHKRERGIKFYSSTWPLQVGENGILCQAWNDYPQYNYLSCTFLLRIVDGKPQLDWENENLAVELQNFTILDGYIYAMDTKMYSGKDIPNDQSTRRKRQPDYGQFQCVDVKTGKTVWHTNDFSDPELDMGRDWTENADKGPTWLIVDDKIIIWNGAQVIIGKPSPEGFERLSAFQISNKPGGTWTAMGFSDGRLFVRSGYHIFGIDLRKDRK